MCLQLNNYVGEWLSRGKGMEIWRENRNQWEASLGLGDTWDRGGSQESMGVTLAETHSSGNIEPEEAISYSQAV